MVYRVTSIRIYLILKTDKTITQYFVSAIHSGSMSFCVQSQMVGPCKALGANFTEERPSSGVFSRVPRQLVRPRKGVAAVLPRTGVRSLSRVDPHVSFKVGALCVNFITVGEGTPMAALHLPTHQRLWPSFPSFNLRLGKGRDFCVETTAHELETVTAGLCGWKCWKRLKSIIL